MADSAINWIKERFERDIPQFATWNKNVTEWEGDLDDESGKYNPHKQVRLWLDTATNRYHIKAKIKDDKSTYLGCIANSKKWRVGEDWHRGNDLPDGPMNDETWWSILGAIIGYELQDK